MTGAGFLGALFRYQASEIAPVDKDAFNYVAENVQPGLQAMVSTAASALREGQDKDPPTEYPRGGCPACNKTSGPDAHFCSHCGTELPPKQPTRAVCATCQTPNDLDARFCDSCGKKMAR